LEPTGPPGNGVTPGGGDRPELCETANVTPCPVDDGLLVVDASGQVAPVDLGSLARGGKTIGLNQRFARMWQVSDNTLERLKIEQELRRGLERDEFEVYLQPQADVETNQVVGAEALVRWRHPERGLVLPDDFIPIAEETGLIVQLGERVLRAALEQAARRQQRSMTGLRISVNLSTVQFRDPNLASMVSDAVDEAGLDPRVLELEITESTAMCQAALAVEVMRDLASLGVKLSLDDFGTGYSSLQYLKEFPIHALKIDRSFVSGVTADANSAAIVGAVVAIGQSLGLTVIAEGIETAPQLAFLKEQGCAWYQGFLLGRPMPAEAFDSMVRRQAA
jgi:EAL domain-containing protein (putative c-di-GMP-specific phosphodiesterase class I)